MIDLAMMIGRCGPVPKRSVEKAEAAYGSSILQAWQKGTDLLSDDDYLRTCMQAMGMDLDLLPRIQCHLQNAWPRPDDASSDFFNVIGEDDK